MKKLLFIFYVAVLMTALQDVQAQNFVWAKQFTGTLSVVGKDMSLDAVGNVCVTGYFQSTADFDPGPGTYNLTSAGNTDVFVTKLDTSGNLLWAKKIGGPSIDYVHSIAVDVSGNIYVTGTFRDSAYFDPGLGTYNLTAAGEEDVFIIKFDAFGNLIWVKQLGGTSSDQDSSVALDDIGNVYVTGHFYGTADFDPGAGMLNLTSAGGDKDVFIVKLDASGNLIWVKQVGGPLSDEGRALTVDASGDVYVTGYFEGTVDFDSGPGTFNLTSAGGANAFITKLDASGNLLWAKQFSGLSNTDFVAVDATGNVHVTGFFLNTVDFNPNSGSYNLTSAGDFDIFIAKLNSSGNFIWAKQFGGTYRDRLLCIAIDSLGNIYATGYFEGTADFDPGLGIFNLTSSGYNDAFIIKLDAFGNLMWAMHSEGPSNNEESSSVVVDTAGNVFVSGYFLSTVDFDPGSGTFNLTSGGAQDVFVLKLAQTAPFVIQGISATDVTCYGDSNGTASVLVSGGLAPYQYLWSNSTTMAIATGLSVGDYFVTITDATGISLEDTVNITEPSLLSAIIDSVTHGLCHDDRIGTATATPTGGTPPYSFIWNDGQTGFTAIDLSAGNYQVTVTDSNGCQLITSITIQDGYQVPAGTIAGADSADINQTSTYSVNAGLSYTWSVTNGTILSGQGTNSVEVEWNTIGQGTVEVAVTDSGCTQTVSKTVALIDPTGIESDLLNAIKLYPNPTKGTITLKATNISSTASLKLYDSIGKQVLQQTATALELQQGIVFDLKEINEGVYFLNIKTEEGTRVMKVVRY